MGFEEQTARIERLTRLIEGSKTGTASELAKNLSVSRRAIFRDLAFLRKKGLKITYKKSVNSYLFEK